MAIEGINSTSHSSLSARITSTSRKEDTSDESRLDAAPKRGETSPAPKIDERFLERVAKALDLSNVSREYEVYDKLGKVYIRLYDKESGELIREIPPEELVELARKMEKITGMLFRQTI